MAEMNSSNTRRRTLPESASFVVASVRAMGINPNAQSRMMKMDRALAKDKKIVHPDDPDFETVLEAQRDMQLLANVFDQSVARGDSVGFRSLVKRMLDDSVLPQEDRGQSKGRDAQFELVVAANCQSAGLVPVEYEEPDVTCTVDGSKVAIAAKRVKKVSNLRKRLKKAARQIEATKIRGVVALDTTLALNLANERISTPIPDDQFGRLYKQSFIHFLDRYHRSILDWVDGKGVLGVMFHDYQVRFDGQWGLAGMTFFFPTAGDDAQANREFLSFQESYLKGLPDLQLL